MKIKNSLDAQIIDFSVEDKDIEISDIFYNISYKLQDLYSLNKLFGQFYTISEEILLKIT